MIFIHITYPRWCINLILRSVDKMLMCNSTMDSEDLTEAEPQSLCAFFCYLFMMLYKFRQCNAVVKIYVRDIHILFIIQLIKSFLKKIKYLT